MSAERSSATGLKLAARLRKNIRATTAVEFAIIAPALFAMVFGIFVVGQMCYAQSTLQSAVDTSGRKIATTKGITQAALTTAVQDYLVSLGFPRPTVAYATVTISGVQLGHLTATSTATYTIPFVHTYNMTYVADTYLPTAL